eukprot:gene8327-14291_t
MEDEVAKATKQMSSGKAPGPAAISAEVFTSGGSSLIAKMTELFQSVWESETLPQEFKDATIAHIYKRKDNRRSCDNHRGISLLAIVGKILVCVLLNRILRQLEQGHLPESQCGFRVDRGTIDRRGLVEDNAKVWLPGQVCEDSEAVSGRWPEYWMMVMSLTRSHTKKTKVLYLPAPRNLYQELNITVKGQRLQAEENFTYLGSTLSSSANNDAEVNNRIAKASSAFGRLRKLAWERRGISQDTKIKVYKAVVLSTPLTDGMKNNYNMFISGAFPASSTSAGNIRFLIQKCWKEGLSQRYHHYAKGANPLGCPCF